MHVSIPTMNADAVERLLRRRQYAIVRTTVREVRWVRRLHEGGPVLHVSVPGERGRRWESLAELRVTVPAGNVVTGVSVSAWRLWWCVFPTAAGLSLLGVAGRLVWKLMTEFATVAWRQAGVVGLIAMAALAASLVILSVAVSTVEAVRRERRELAAELIAYCRSHLAHFKCPRSVDFDPELAKFVANAAVVGHRRLVHLAGELPALRQLDEDEAGRRVDEDGVVGHRDAAVGGGFGLGRRRSGETQAGGDGGGGQNLAHGGFSFWGSVVSGRRW